MGATFSALLIVVIIPQFILIILSSIMIYQFFILKSKAKLWVHITFGTALGFSLIQYILFYLSISSVFNAVVELTSLINIAFYIFFWWAIIDYIKKKKIDGKPLFN